MIQKLKIVMQLFRCITSGFIRKMQFFFLISTAFFLLIQKIQKYKNKYIRIYKNYKESNDNFFEQQIFHNILLKLLIFSKVLPQLRQNNHLEQEYRFFTSLNLSIRTFPPVHKKWVMFAILRTFCGSHAFLVKIIIQFC